MIILLCLCVGVLNASISSSFDEHNAQSAYKTELDLNNKQRTCLAKHAGTARFAYNWGLARKIAAYQAGLHTPTAIDLHRELNVLKKTELNWMYEVSKCAPQEALRNLDKAFLNFFRRVSLKKAGKWNGKISFPKFKSKKVGKGSFRLTGTIHVWDSCIQLPRLGLLRLKERGYFPTCAKINSATVSERAGRWFVSVQVEEEIETPQKATGEPLGVDLGIKKMAVCSDGNYFENPKAVQKSLRALRRAQRELSRRKKGGKNRSKSRQKVAKLHYRIANIRSDARNKATTSIVTGGSFTADDQAKNKPQDRRPSVVVIEDLSVSGMLKNHKLARAISDVGFGEFRRQLTYKTALLGISLLVADRFFPSSKLCSAVGESGCTTAFKGAINDNLTLNDREWICSCGALHDRDRNAAINLSRLAPRPTL
jgi:putative transposase